MSETDIKILDNLRKSVIAIGITFVFTSLFAWVGFYYTTKEKIKNIEVEIAKKADENLVNLQYETLLREIQDLKD